MQTPIPGFSNYMLLERTNETGHDVVNLKTGKFLRAGSRDRTVFIYADDGTRKILSVNRLRRELFPCIGEHHQFEWRPIPGYERYGIYRRRTPGGADVFRIENARPLNTRFDHEGYNKVFIKRDSDGQYVNVRLARLRLFAYVGPPPDPAFTADHISRDRSDDSIENLRWASPSDQVRNQRAERRPTRQKYAIKRVCLETGETETFDSMRDVSDTNRYVVYDRLRKRVKKTTHTYEFVMFEPRDGERMRNVPGTQLVVSDMGRIARQTPHGLVEIKLVPEPGKYPIVSVNRKQIRVHRVVYETFVGEIPHGMVVDHVNEDKTDFRLENLRLVSQKQNMSLYQASIVLMTNIRTKERIVANSAKEAAELLGTRPPSVTAYLLGKRKNPTWDFEKLCSYHEYVASPLRAESMIYFMDAFNRLN